MLLLIAHAVVVAHWIRHSTRHAEPLSLEDQGYDWALSTSDPATACTTCHWAGVLVPTFASVSFFALRQ